jgi:phytoene synthase
MAVDHYENFPVASLLLPPDLRDPVAAIYAFARSADDFADEGDLDATQRMTLLDGYRRELDAVERGQPTHNPVFLRLRPVIDFYALPIQLFRDLLEAFIQDITQDRYESFDELLAYCRRSADPVGRLMLHLFKAANDENCRRSDAICSALQLINHWQDVGIDITKGPRGRIYLPQDDMARFKVSDESLVQRRADENFRALLQFQTHRARSLMQSGASLGWDLPGRVGMEIRAVIAGGLTILDKIEAVDCDVFNRRPSLQALDWPRIFWSALVRPS